MKSHPFNMSSFSLSIVLLFLWPQSHEYLSTRIRLLVVVANVTRKTLPIMISDMSDPNNLHVCGVQLCVIKASFIIFVVYPVGPH